MNIIPILFWDSFMLMIIIKKAENILNNIWMEGVGGTNRIKDKHHNHLVLE